LGLSIFLLALCPLFGSDALGWAVTTAVWTDVSKALGPVSKVWSGAPGWLCLIATLAFLTALLAGGMKALGVPARRFIPAFAGVAGISYLAWIAGSWAYVAATPDRRHALGVGWSLSLTAEAGFLVALVAGLLVGNFLPRIAAALKEAIRPELYVKTGIVLLGGFLGITATEQLGLASTVMFRGLCAIVEAYLIYWAIVYYVARRYFRFSREWAAPLASGISICGVSAAIATGSAIKARPVIPVMVSSLVVIFAVMELMLLPFLAQTFLWREPMVAGAWMGLAVKTDGAAVASGAIAESLIRARAAAEGVIYRPGWIVGATTTVKVFIDVFIGVWSFVLAWIWSTKIEPGRDRAGARHLWERFPKFVFGYLATFAAVMNLGMSWPSLVPKIKAGVAEANIFRGIFFVMTFFTIGVVSNFRKLWEAGIARLAAVYVLCLFGFIIWVGLAISWLFFHGVKPPIEG
jgi:uncharacterized membrane protein YadS